MIAIESNDEAASTSTKKKRRLDGATKAAPLLLGAGCNLPAEMWANALGYLYFDEVLRCTSASKFFLRDVTRRVKCLCVRFGESMDVADTVVERFGAVEEVYVYLLRKLNDRNHKIHLDSAALKHAAPFLSGLPNLSRGFLGGEYKEHWLEKYDGPTYTARYRSFYECEKDYGDPNANVKYATMIHSFCKEYRMGKLSADVEIEGLIPIPIEYDSELDRWTECAFKRLRKVDYYRSDVACQTCDMICMSFPPSKLLALSVDDVPCISAENRVVIARLRDEANFEQNSTLALLNLIRDHHSVTGAHALAYEKWEYNMMACLTSNGANINDPRIHAYFNGSDKNTEIHRLEGRVAITLEAFNKLKGLGLRLQGIIFAIIDIDKFYRRRGVVLGSLEADSPTVLRFSQK
ncbi:hypothetical protein ACHAWF_017266 [Thalassiosira exigua]